MAPPREDPTSFLFGKIVSKDRSLASTTTKPDISLKSRKMNKFLREELFTSRSVRVGWSKSEVPSAERMDALYSKNYKDLSGQKIENMDFAENLRKVSFGLEKNKFCWYFDLSSDFDTVSIFYCVTDSILEQDEKYNLSVSFGRNKLFECGFRSAHVKEQLSKRLGHGKLKLMLPSHGLVHQPGRHKDEFQFTSQPT